VGLRRVPCHLWYSVEHTKVNTRVLLTKRLKLGAFDRSRKMYPTLENSSMGDDHGDDGDGMVMDILLAVERYTQCVRTVTDENSAYYNPSVGAVASQILEILTRATAQNSSINNDNDDLCPR